MTFKNVFTLINFIICVIHLAQRRLLKESREKCWKRIASTCGGDSCCGVRDDCKMKPCKDEDKCFRGSNIDYRKNCTSELDLMKFIPKCCVECDALPLFDWLYYEPSDKKCRQYQKTWRDCPPVTKKRCCYGELPPYPPYKKRNPRGDGDECRAPTACEKNKGVFDAVCKAKTNDKCPNIKLECCRPGRRPPSCKKPQVMKCCEKTCCPYPAFSECCIGGRAKLLMRSQECRCHDNIEACVLNRILAKQGVKQRK